MGIPRPSTATRRDTIALWGLLVIVVLTSLWALLSVPYVPTNDGPQMVLTVHMEEHYAGSIYEDQFALGYQIGSRGFALIYAPLYQLFHWARALAIFESILVLLTGLGGLALTHALEPARKPAALLAFPLAFSWLFYMGFLNFAVGTAVGVWVLAWVVHRPSPTLPIRAGITAALWIQTFCHAISAALTGALIAAVVLTRAYAARDDDESHPRHEWLWLTVTGAPILALLLLLRSETSQLAGVADSQTTDFRSLADIVAQTPHILAPGALWRGLIALGIVLVSLGSFAFAWRRRSASTTERAVAASAAVLVVLGCFGPMHIPGWQYVAPRLLATGLVLCVVLLPVEALFVRAPRYVVTAGVAAITVALAMGARQLNARLFTPCADAFAGLDAPLKRSFMQLPITFDPTCGLPRRANTEIPHQQAGIHLGALHAVAHGGGVPWVFSGPPAVHAFTPRKKPVAPPPPYALWEIGFDERVQTEEARREAALDLATTAAMGYENLVVNGARETDIAYLERRGFVPDFTRGSHFNGHLVPCEVTVRAPGRPGEPPPALFVGLRADLAPVRLRLVRYATGDWIAPLRAACGPQFAAIVFADGKRCTNADEEGRISFVASREETEVVCER